MQIKSSHKKENCTAHKTFFISASYQYNSEAVYIIIFNCSMIVVSGNLCEAEASTEVTAETGNFSLHEKKEIFFINKKLVAKQATSFST